MIRKIKHIIFLCLYYGIAQYLPSSYMPIIGKYFNYIRIFCVKRIFKKCGNITTIERKAYFGNGYDIEIGDFSGIGRNCIIPNNIKIGNYVMIGPDLYIANNNHEYKDINIPMCFQGIRETKRTIIEDDCWIGAKVIITPGKTLRQGSIIAAGAVVTKDIDSYSIVGGNPAKIIKSRITQK